MTNLVSTIILPAEDNSRDGKKVRSGEDFRERLHARGRKVLRGEAEGADRDGASAVAGEVLTLKIRDFHSAPAEGPEYNSLWSRKCGQ